MTYDFNVVLMLFFVVSLMTLLVVLVILNVQFFVEKCVNLNL